MMSGLGTKIAHELDKGQLRQAFSFAFLPESWRREACLEDGTHEVIFMHSGDWYCYSCGAYDNPGSDSPAQ